MIFRQVRYALKFGVGGPAVMSGCFFALLILAIAPPALHASQRRPTQLSVGSGLSFAVMPN